jgi:hypothetical protein
MGEEGDVETRAGLPEAWWRRGWVVVAMTAFVAGAFPVTAAIREHDQTEREVALEQGRQAHALAVERERQGEQLRSSYLDRANQPADRYRILRLILATTQDATLRAWAEGEKALFEKELAGAQKRIDEAEAALAAARAAQATMPPSASAAPPPNTTPAAPAALPPHPPVAAEMDVRLQQAKLEEARAKQRKIDGDGF